MTDKPETLPPVRISRLQRIALSPAHYQCYDETAEQTSAMSLGAALHAHVLLGTEIAVCDVRRDVRTKKYQEFLESSKGKLVLTEGEARHVAGMTSALRAHPLASQLIFGLGSREQTMYWDWMDRACRGTPDIQRPRQIVELKTTRCAKPDVFQRDAERRGYDVQLAWYNEGAYANYPAFLGARDLWIVAVESSPPYAVVCHLIEPARVDKCERQIRLWFERLLQCEASGEWPAYTDAAVQWPLYGHADVDDLGDEADEILA